MKSLTPTFQVVGKKQIRSLILGGHPNKKEYNLTASTNRQEHHIKLLILIYCTAVLQTYRLTSN